MFGGRFVACLVAAVIATASAPRSVRAQTMDDDDRQARAEFLAGRAAFGSQDFAEAARRFERAIALSHRPQLYFNLGMAYDRLRRWHDARDAFRQFLSALPNAPEANEARARLVVVYQELDRESQAAASRAPPPSSTPPPIVRVVVRTVPRESRPYLVAGVAAGGLALIAGIVSVTVGLLTNSLYDQLANSCGMTAAGCAQASIDDIELRATLTNGFGITAGVLALGAVALLVLDWRRPRPVESRVRLRFAPVMAARSNAGFLLLSGAF